MKSILSQTTRCLTKPCLSRWVLVGAIVAIVLIAQPAWACPNCKDSLATGSNAFNLVRGFFWSIVFMMSMPFLILGGVGSYFYWEVRKARARMAAPMKPPPLGEIT